MPKIHKVTFNGTASDTLGVFVSGTGSFDSPELSVTKYDVPGRNGDVVISNNKYKNITVTYPAFVPGNFSARVQAIRNWLRGTDSYVELSDDYDTTHFRLARVAGGQTFEPVLQNSAANFQLVFDCKPQRFLTSGKTLTTYSTGATISNGTQFVAYPVFEATNTTGSATIKIVNSLGTFQLSANTGLIATITIDCESQNIYYGSTNRNSTWSGSFPVLAPGTNTLTFSGVGTLKMATRFWEL